MQTIESKLVLVFSLAIGLATLHVSSVPIAELSNESPASVLESDESAEKYHHQLHQKGFICDQSGCLWNRNFNGSRWELNRWSIFVCWKQPIPIHTNLILNYWFIRIHFQARTRRSNILRCSFKRKPLRSRWNSAARSNEYQWPSAHRHCSNSHRCHSECFGYSDYFAVDGNDH